jgi:amidase
MSAEPTVTRGTPDYSSGASSGGAAALVAAGVVPIAHANDGGGSPRSVRDTATFFAAAERYWRNPALPPLGLVQGPAERRLRIGLLTESVGGIHTERRDARGG